MAHKLRASGAVCESSLRELEDVVLETIGEMEKMRDWGELDFEILGVGEG